MITGMVMLVLGFFVCLFICAVPHPTFGLSGTAGSWVLLAVFSCSSARLTSRCHRRMRGEEGESHPGIRSLTQRHSAVALCHIPCSQSTTPLSAASSHSLQPMASSLRCLLFPGWRWTPAWLTWGVFYSGSPHLCPRTPKSPVSFLHSQIVQWLLVYLFLLIRLLHYMFQAQGFVLFIFTKLELLWLCVM